MTAAAVPFQMKVRNAPWFISDDRRNNKGQIVPCCFATPHYVHAFSWTFEMQENGFAPSLPCISGKIYIFSDFPIVDVIQYLTAHKCVFLMFVKSRWSNLQIHRLAAVASPVLIKVHTNITNQQVAENPRMKKFDVMHSSDGHTF